MYDRNHRLRSSGGGRLRLALVGAIAFAAITLLASTASATVMTYADIDRLVDISDVIVHGTVVEQDTYFDKQQQRVVTDTTLSVERDLYGANGDEVTFQQWGGTYEGKTHRVPGDATFEQGEEVILFLHRGDGVLAPAAMGQSKFSVRDMGDEKLATRDFRDLEVLIEGPAGRDQILQLPEETRVFDALLAELQTVIAGIKQSEPQLPSGGDETHE